MKNVKRTTALVLLAMGMVVSLAAPAAAADGICGGVGTYNPVTGECE